MTCIEAEKKERKSMKEVKEGSYEQAIIKILAQLSYTQKKEVYKYIYKIYVMNNE